MKKEIQENYQMSEIWKVQNEGQKPEEILYLLTITLKNAIISFDY